MTEPGREQCFRYAERFGDLGNYLVGFAAAQTLAFLYALGNDDFLGKVDHVPACMVGAVILSTAISEFLVRRCYVQEARLLTGEDGKAKGKDGPAGELSNAVRLAYRGRALVLVLIGIGGIAGYLAARMPGDRSGDATRDSTIIITHASAPASGETSGVPARTD